MGVLNYGGPIIGQNVPVGVLTVEDYSTGNDEQELGDNFSSTQQRRAKNRRHTYQHQAYDFREYGVDLRRKGSRHERRKQNMCDLLAFTGKFTEENFGDDMLAYASGTAFTELFLSEKKMEAWQGFMSLSEEEQNLYLDEVDSKKSQSAPSKKQNDLDSENYLLVDKRIRDILRSQRLAEELLEYYEDDVISCMEDCVSSVLVMQEDSGFRRLLIHGLCQYLRLQSTTIKMDDRSFMEIEVGVSALKSWRPPAVRLSALLRR